MQVLLLKCMKLQFTALNFEIFNNLVPDFIEITLLITGQLPNLLNSSKVSYNGLNELQTRTSIKGIK